MNATKPLSRVRYAQRKEKVFEEELESWQRDYHNAQFCLDVQDLIRDINRHFEDILELDRDIRDDYANGLEYSEDLEGRLLGLMAGWVSLGRKLLTIIEYLEKNNFEVDGAKQVRHNYREALAIIAPDSDNVTDAMVSLRDQAIEDHRAGKTVEGLRG